MELEITKKELTTPMAVLIAGILISGSILMGFSWISPSKGKVLNMAKATVDAGAKAVNTDGEPFVGSPDAPVTVTYWFDYQCPFCKLAEGKVISPLMQEFVKDGQVKIVFKGMQFLGADSQSAGIASYAVWEAAPQKFNAWHTAMFDKQDTENGGWGNAKDIAALTKEVLGDADAAKVASLIATKSAVYQKMIDADRTEANTFNISGTPSFTVNDTVVLVRDYSDIENAVKNLLK